MSSHPTADAAASPDDRLIGLSAVQAVAAMRNGDLSAETYASALLAQERRFRALNAFRTIRPDAVLEAARGADLRRRSGGTPGLLHGLPIPIKDSVDTASLPTSNGTRTLRGFQPRRDAAVASRLFAEGAILMGKTNLHELSFGWTSANESFGAVRNAYDPARSPGGSSGGSASAVAARMAPLAVAEDTWASIRLPAAFSGLAGFRPTYGRYPDDGIMPLTTMFDQVGPLARGVADLALFDAVASGRADSERRPADIRRLRIGLPERVFWEGLDPEVERVARAAVTRLREAGAEIVEIATPALCAEAPEIAGTVIAHEARDSIASFLAKGGAPVGFDDMFEGVGATVKALMTAMALPPNRPSPEAYRAALDRRAALKAEVAATFAGNGLTALVFPVAMIPPPLVGEETEAPIGGRAVPLATALARNTALGSCLSMASLVLPAGLDAASLPVGLEFAGLAGSDEALLDAGLALEQALGEIAPPALLRA